MKARVFLSYARNDGKVACDFFHKALENAKYLVWRDIDNVAGGAQWRQAIEDAIRNVDVVLLFLTPGAIDSKNVEEEWRTAIRFKKRIVPLLVTQTAVPPELLSYNYRDIRETAAYQLEPSIVQRDLEDERRNLRTTLEGLRTQIGERIADTVRQKYLEPFADYLRIAVEAEPAAMPPEVFQMLFSLLAKLVDELAAGRDITFVVEEMTAGTYTADPWEEKAIYQLRITEFAHILKKVRDAIPSISVPVIVVAMTGAEAADLASGTAFAGLPPEWQTEFEAIRPDLPAGWQQRYAASSQEWEPFVGKGSVAALVAGELKALAGAGQWSVRSAFVDIRDLPLKTSRQQLLSLRAGGCLVVMDAISAWHPKLQAAFRATSLDFSSNVPLVRVLPHQTLDSVRDRVGFLLREWLNCEFFQRADLDRDERCRTVMIDRDLNTWMYNRFKDAATARTTQSDLRKHINNFGG